MQTAVTGSSTRRSSSPKTPYTLPCSSPHPRRHTASPASQTRASAPAGSATPRRFLERPRRSLRPMLPESASRPPGDKNKTSAQLNRHHSLWGLTPLNFSKQILNLEFMGSDPLTKFLRSSHVNSQSMTFTTFMPS